MSLCPNTLENSQDRVYTSRSGEVDNLDSMDWILSPCSGKRAVSLMSAIMAYSRTWVAAMGELRCDSIVEIICGGVRGRAGSSCVGVCWVMSRSPYSPTHHMQAN